MFHKQHLEDMPGGRSGITKNKRLNVPEWDSYELRGI
jgi:hypothetical protein